MCGGVCGRKNWGAGACTAHYENAWDVRAGADENPRTLKVCSGYEEKSHLFNPTPNFAAKFWIEKIICEMTVQIAGATGAAVAPPLSMSVLLLCAQLNWPVEFRLLSWEYLSCPDWLRGNSSESQTHSWVKKQNPAKNKFAWSVFTSFSRKFQQI